MKTTTTQTTAQLAAIREQLERADRYPLSQQQIGAVILAVSALTDLVERLAERIEATPHETNYAAMRAFSAAMGDE